MVYRKIQDMAWPAPCERMDELEWGLRFREPTMEDAGLVDRLEVALMQTLSQAGFTSVDVQVRAFLPETVPSIALATPQTIARQNLKSIMSQNWVLSSLGNLTALV